MAAVTTDQRLLERAVALKQFDTEPIATNQTVYVGTMCVSAPGTNRVRNGVKTASYVVRGIVEEIVNDSGAGISAATGNTAGTIKARFSYGQEVLLTCITAARTYTNLNKTACLSDNVSVDGTAVGTTLVRLQVGQIMEFEPGTSLASVWVKIRTMGTGLASG